MFHLLAYHVQTVGGPTTLQDVPSISDPVITQQQSHYIFTDDFRLGLILAAGATITEAGLNAPTINAFGRHNVWPLEASGVQPYVNTDLQQYADYMTQPIVLPQEEQIAWLASQTTNQNEDEVVLMWIFTPDHQMTVPSGVQRLTVQAKPGSSFSAPTAITSVAYAWTGLQPLAFEQNLRGGWYSVVGFNGLDPNTLAARLIFPRSRQYDGRVLRPGAPMVNALTRRPNPRFMGRIGVFGKFHSFEPPQVEILAVNAGAHNPTYWLDLVYHGESEPTTY